MIGQAYSIWWIRGDLRLQHNRALAAAARGGRKVVPVFVLDRNIRSDRADKRRRFMLAGLRSLDSELRKHGSQVFIMSGDPATILPQLSRSIGAEVFANEDFTPYARKRDCTVAERTRLHVAGGLTAMHPAEVLNAEGNPYRVYSHFKKTWLDLAMPSPEQLDPKTISFAPPATLDSEPMPQVSSVMDAGELEAGRAFERFIRPDGALWRYTSDRSLIDGSTTSGLSPFVKFGMISVEHLLERAMSLANDDDRSASQRESARTWLNELIWREFFQSAIYHFPDSTHRSLRAEFREMEWNDSEEDLAAWQQGVTGYPIVDAAMRQLGAEGWIHNRCRMIVASFLVKDLLIDWRHGASWFMEHLLDGDTAANVGGWQWSAGTGLDAAPYFRIFNPVTQAKKFDPRGIYVRRWLPELRGVEDRHVHEPWHAGASVAGYPAPIVEHAAARRSAIEAFATARARYQDRIAQT